MASDVLALMDYLHVRKVAIVGWSDGAIIGLDIAMHHPEQVSKLFAFAANSDPSGVADIFKEPGLQCLYRAGGARVPSALVHAERLSGFPRSSRKDMGDAAALDRGRSCLDPCANLDRRCRS
jgi:pimeloyl-ACP methyl ester carboxylesterase